jgi:hypothetical protein
LRRFFSIVTTIKRENLIKMGQNMDTKYSACFYILEKKAKIEPGKEVRAVP